MSSECSVVRFVVFKLSSGTVASQEQFVAGFQNPAPPVANDSVCRKHRLSEEWNELMEKRDWLSQTPEASRGSIAAWACITSWWPARGFLLKDAKVSNVLPANKVLVSPEGDAFFCIGSSRWGCLVLKLDAVATWRVDGGTTAKRGQGRASFVGGRRSLRMGFHNSRNI